MFEPDPVPFARGPSPSPLSRVLIVAGPTGAGKSTFLHRLASGTLPREIASALPRGCEAWPQALAMELEALLASKQDSPPLDVALHYNTLRLIGDGLDDPVLQVVAKASSVHAVTMASPPERLSLQLGHRSFGGRTPAETHAIVRQVRFREALGKMRSARTAFAALFQPRAPARFDRTDTPAMLSILRFYRKRLWLQSLSRRWDEFLRFLAARNCLDGEIVLSPTGDIFAATDFRWAVLKRTERQATPAEVAA